MKIIDLFNLQVGKSKANDDYDPGNIPYISSTTINNGVVQFVEPYPDDKVFEGGVICISGLGFATLQLNDFLPKANGGDSATVLIPRKRMSIKELIFYTATFNLLHNWRFSFGRKANKTRLEQLEILPFDSYKGNFFNDFEKFANTFSKELKHYKKLIE